MSNLLFNIRFGKYHWQLSRDWRMSWTYNDFHELGHREAGWKWFVVYCAFGKHYQ